MVATVCPLAAVLVLTAATSDPGPRAVVEATLGEAQRVANGEGTRQQKAAQLLDVARHLLDTHEMGRRALGARFDQRTPAERAEYLTLFDELIVQAYLRRLLLFSDPRFALHAPEVSGDRSRMRTVIETPADEYSVEYVLRRHGQQWRATDIVVEGLSLTDSYRAQFASLLEHRSFESLLDLMRRKLRPRAGSAP